MSTEPKLIPLRIRLPYQTEEEFIEKYGSNVARGGVFIATRALKPEGSQLAFEFVLADGRRLIRGDGVVVKAQVDQGGTRAGMTVRFVRLDSASKAMIDRLVAARSGVSAQPPEHVISTAPAAAPATAEIPPLRRELGGTSGRPASETGGSGTASAERPVAEAAPRRGTLSPQAGVDTAAAAEATAAGAASPNAALAAAPTSEASDRVSAYAMAGPGGVGAGEGPETEPVGPRDVASAAVTAPAKSQGAEAEAASGEVAAPEDSPTMVAASDVAASDVAASDVAESEVAASDAAASDAAASDAAASDAAASDAAASDAAASDTAASGVAASDVAASEAAHTDLAAAENAAPLPAVSAPTASQVVAPAPPAIANSQAPTTAGAHPSPSAAAAASAEALARGSSGVRSRRRPSLLDAPEPTAPRQEIPEVVLGIDLGTTNARVAVYREGSPQLIPLTPDGKTAVPSCVALDEAGELIVGEAARGRMAHAPLDAVIAAKRLIGQRARSKRVKEQAGQVPFELVADSTGDAGVRLRDRVRSLTEVSAALLSSLKASAEAFVGHPVSRAVLCVPAYFTDHQRAAMREAGRMAGLEVVRIFNEPSAVALAFGHGKALPRKRILVYDLGGGTFDATVVEVTGDELEAVANGGDNFLGGMDFDARIVASAAQRFESQHQVPLNTSPISSLRLRDAAERAKIALSEAESYTLHLAGAALRPDGASVDLQLELTRADLETLTADLVERTLQVTREVLASANLTPQSLDEVLLVGGQSRAPLVRKKVEELVGHPVRTDVDAQAAVALGAAILGHAALEAAKGKPGVSLSEVLSAPIGIATRNGGMRRVLERNTRLPAEKTILLPARSGETIGVAVFQGPAERADDNEYLGCLNATLEKNGELAVRFSLASDGTLALTASGPGGRGAQVTITTDDASDELRAALFASAPLPGEEEGGKKGMLGGIKRLFGRR